MNRHTKKGFLSLEATLFLPVFIIAVLTVGYLMKIVIAEEKIMHAMVDEGRRLSAYSYNIKTAPIFEASLRWRILEENKDVDAVYVESFRYLYSNSGKDDLIGLRVSSNIRIKLPIVFYESVDISDTLFFRGFTGREYIPEELDFENLEDEDESRIVWVFPVAGARYHEIACSYINVAARQSTLTSELRKKYKSCSLCSAGELPLGSVIYYFESSGEVFHRGSCFIVDRYVISMEEEDAIKKGYTPCSKCI